MGIDREAGAASGERAGAAGDRRLRLVRFFDTLLPDGRPERTAQVAGSASPSLPEPHTPMTAKLADNAPPQRSHPIGWAAGRAVVAA